MNNLNFFLWRSMTEYCGAQFESFMFAVLLSTVPKLYNPLGIELLLASKDVSYSFV